MAAIVLKTKEEIELMRESALIVSKTLGMLAAEIKPGITTLKLDKLAEAFIRDHKAEPGFLGLYDFPNTLCMRSHAGIASTAFNALADAGINIQMISTSEIKITIVISGDQLEEAVKTLHSAFNLGD